MIVRVQQGMVVLPCLLVALCVLSASAFDSIVDRPKPPRNIFGESAGKKAERLRWWTEARFGMFIHFGLYAMPARGEWVKTEERLDDKSYEERYFPCFNPDLFDAKEWARAAKRAGMKYMVLTTKHHDGFCLWDTKTTDYKITTTPFGRDLVREFSEACRAEGLHVGFYFSIKDWHHPDYTVDQTHPLRPKDDRFTDDIYEKLNAGKDWNRYREYMYAQIRELLTDYGKIDIVWFDYTVKEKYGKNWKDWESVELLKMTRKLQPQILVDSRLDLMDTEDGWDFVTPEQSRVSQWPLWEGKKACWETCQTFSGSWGYHRDENTWKSSHQLIELLINSVSYGGNLILNVGPTARGDFDDRATDRLEAIGRWMKRNSRSIYGCTAAPEGFSAPSGTMLTYNPALRRLYVHVCDYPMGEIPFGFSDKVRYAQFLHDGSEIVIRHGDVITHAQAGDVGTRDNFVLPMLKPSVEVPVIECFLKE